MSRPHGVDVVRYLSWRAWLRVRYGTRCLVCGRRTAGHHTQTDAELEGYRHLAWHGLLEAILRRAVRDGIVPRSDDG